MGDGCEVSDECEVSDGCGESLVDFWGRLLDLGRKKAWVVYLT
jgi:hypothetical protein